MSGILMYSKLKKPVFIIINACKYELIFRLCQKRK